MLHVGKGKTHLWHMCCIGAAETGIQTGPRAARSWPRDTGQRLNGAERVGGEILPPLGARRRALPSHQTSWPTPRRFAGGRSASFVSWHMPETVMEAERHSNGRREAQPPLSASPARGRLCRQLYSRCGLGEVRGVNLRRPCSNREKSFGEIGKKSPGKQLWNMGCPPGSFCSAFL